MGQSSSPSSSLRWWPVTAIGALAICTALGVLLGVKVNKTTPSTTALSAKVKVSSLAKASRTAPRIRPVVLKACVTSGQPPKRHVRPPTPGLPAFEGGQQTLQTEFPTVYGGIEQHGLTHFTVFETINNANFEAVARAIYGKGTSFAKAPKSWDCLQAAKAKIWPGGPAPSFHGIKLVSLGYGADNLIVGALAGTGCEATLPTLRSDLHGEFPGVPASVGCVQMGHT